MDILFGSPSTISFCSSNTMFNQKNYLFKAIPIFIDVNNNIIWRRKKYTPLKLNNKNNKFM